MASKAVIDTLIAEAGGEGEDGLIAAAWAIQQRAAANGVSIDRVVRSGFDGFTNPGSGAVKAQADPALRAKVERIMSGVESGSIPNPVPGADHFLSGDVMPSWAKGMKLVATVGGHRFYASGKVPEDKQGNSVGTQLDVSRPAPTPAVASRAVTVARNKQNMTPAADTAPRTSVTPTLTKDGRGVTDPAAIVLGNEMTTRLPAGVSASDKARGQTGAKPKPPSPPTPPVAPRGYVPGPAPTPPSPPTAPKPSNVASAKSEQAAARGAGNPARPVVTPPSNGKAGAGVATARSEQSSARGPVVKPETAVEAITRAATIASPSAAPKPADRLRTPALAFTTPSQKQPNENELEAATGFRVGTLLGGAVAPAIQSAAMIAARQPKKVAPVPVVRTPVAVAPRKVAVVSPATVARATQTAAVVATGSGGSGGSGGSAPASPEKIKGHTVSGGMVYNPDTARHEYVGKR